MPVFSWTLTFPFSLLLVLTIIVALAALRRGSPESFTKVSAIFALWLIATGALALSGVAGNWDVRPPPMLGFVGAGVIGSLLFARSKTGRKLSSELPLWFLIAFQGFRFPLELLLHRAHVEGLNPVQMTFSGYNFDIVSGILGLAIGLWAWRRPKDQPMSPSIAWAFNLVGLGLLFTIIVIALASTPVFAAFGPDKINTWVTQLPYVWLPFVLVMFALIGHLLLTMRLLADGRASTPAAA